MAFTSREAKNEYARRWRAARRSPRPTVAERFWSKVDKSGDCWVWTGHPDAWGYGRIRVGSRFLKAHRASWEMANDREVPAGLQVMHSCDNPPCVRPDHLSVGTGSQNTLDMYRHRRRVTDAQRVLEAIVAAPYSTPQELGSATGLTALQVRAAVKSLRHKRALRVDMPTRLDGRRAYVLRQGTLGLVAS